MLSTVELTLTLLTSLQS